MASTSPSERALTQRARTVAARLADEYPGSARELCALEFETPFQLLAATILSAQSTDVRVNMVTPELFRAYPDAASLAVADPEAVEEIVRSTGFFRAKTKSLIGMARDVTERFGGEVPRDMEDLVTLPGVGRKTANVLRSVAFDLPGPPGRHPRRPPDAAPRPHRRQGPGQDRARDRRDGPARGAGRAQPPPDPARPRGVPGPDDRAARTAS